MTKFLILFCVSLCFGISNLRAQTTYEKNYYVVIGVFTRLEDAEKQTDETNLKGFSAQYALHSEKKEYYVYLLQTTEQKKAKSFLKQIRKETEYKQAWLYKGNLGDNN
jgi:hypothetical protein